MYGGNGIISIKNGQKLYFINTFLFICKIPPPPRICGIVVTVKVRMAH